MMKINYFYQNHSTMGFIYATIELINNWELENVRRGLMDQDEVKRMRVEMLVDTASLYLCINETVNEVLNLPFCRKRKGQLANGQIVEYDIVGPVELRFGNRAFITEAMLLPGDAECLFGAIPMEGMDVLISPSRQELIINPDHPFYAQSRI